MSETNERSSPGKVKGTRTGLVSSAGGDKTIRVIVENLVRHPLYGKLVRRRRKLAAHDPTNLAKPGDMVEIAPCRRFSKTKSWRLLRVVREATVSTRATVEKG